MDAATLHRLWQSYLNNAEPDHDTSRPEDWINRLPRTPADSRAEFGSLISPPEGAVAMPEVSDDAVGQGGQPTINRLLRISAPFASSNSLMIPPADLERYLRLILSGSTP